MSGPSIIAVLGLAVACCGCRPGPPPTLLRAAWESYKTRYIQPAGNTIDPARGGETISEAQGYAMLRAVWMRDKETFYRAFTWTEQHLKRPDGLYSWRWGAMSGGRVLDANTAADADQEIAFALILASAAFGDQTLLARARELLIAIRAHERIDVVEGWFPAAGNWAVSRRIANLSYFVPYAYPYFARVDPDGRWDSVVATGYALIDRALEAPAGALVPDFTVVTQTGTLASLPQSSGVSGDSSSDALRIFWRVAVDCTLHARVRACSDPLRAQQLTALLARDGALYTRYGLDGTVLEKVESTSFYGAALPYLLAHAPAAARAVRTSKLSEAQITALMSAPDRYYDANWVWFGIAAADGLIQERTPPLARDKGR